MVVGCVTEIKEQEFRVGLTPDCVLSYTKFGHTVLVQSAAGDGAGFSDQEYAEAGAEILPSAREVFNRSDMIVKVKEPTGEEYTLLREGQILYTYLHLAADKPLTEMLMAKKVSGIAYETMEGPEGGLPCLKPMSEIAGRLSVQEGAKYLEKPFGGRGILLGGVPGVQRGKVLVLGAGTVGTNAAKLALGLGAEVTVVDLSATRLEYLSDIFGGHVQTLYSNEANIARCLREADLVIGAVLIPGGAAPKLVGRERLKTMKKGAVMVDVAVDQGGCFETTHPTSHHDPVFEIDGVVHYCVANMPGAVPRTSTIALTATTLRYGLELAALGVKEACKASSTIATGLNTHAGKLTCRAVADALDIAYTPLQEALA